jgi:pimeloyl-ACP methyl ester carboxylesterase
MLAGSRPRPSRPSLRVAAVLVLICLTLWTSAVGCLWVSQSRYVFRATATRRAGVVNSPSLLQLRTPDNLRLDAVTLPSRSGGPFWILFCPPAAGTIHGARLQAQLQALAELGYNVFSFDYRGFGRNAGVPTEEGVYSDALTAYRYLRKDLGIPASRVILAGRSLGSAVAIDLATKVPSAGVLLFSAIDSVPLTGARLYPWAPVRLLASYSFDSLSKAPRVRVPVVQVQGQRDYMVPMSAARALFHAFGGPKLMLDGNGTHNRAGFMGDVDLDAALRRFWPVETEAGAGSG